MQSFSIIRNFETQRFVKEIFLFFSTLCKKKKKKKKSTSFQTKSVSNKLQNSDLNFTVIIIL